MRKHRFLGTILFLLAMVLAVLISCTKDQPPISPLDPNASSEEQAKGAISGFVTDNKGAPLPGVIVSTDLGYVGITDSLGRYSLPDVKSGDYTLRFMRYKYLDTLYTPVSVGAGQHVSVSKIITLRGSMCAIKGRVTLTPGGAGVPGAGVAVAYQSGSALTDGQGYFVLSDVDPSATKVLAALGGTGFGEADVLLEPGTELQNVEISLSGQGGQVSGTVYGSSSGKAVAAGRASAGTPLAGIIVVALNGAVVDTTDLLGRFLLSNLPSGWPLIISAGANGTVCGLVVAEGGLLSGVTIVPLNWFEGHGVKISDRRYYAPGGGNVNIEADVSAGLEKVSLFIWDLDNNGNFDTATATPSVSVKTLADSQAVGYGIITTEGDSLTGAVITIFRVSLLPVVDGGPDIFTAPREPARLAGSARCLAGGIKSYAWDFDNNGGFDWTRYDGGEVSHRYLAEDTVDAVFKVTTILGTVVYDTVRVFVAGAPAAIPGGAVLPPAIASPSDHDTVGGAFTLSWQGGEPGVTYNVYYGEASPPAIKMAGTMTDSVLVISGLNAQTLYYFQVEAVKGDSSAKSLCIAVLTGQNHAPVLSIGSPSDNAALSGDSVAFVFLAPDADNDTVHYNVYFSADDPPSLYRAGVTDTILKAAPVSGWMDSLDYFWQIEASDGKDSVLSAPRRFIHMRPRRTDADLAAIGLSAGALSPAFNRDTLLYNVALGYAVDSVTLTPMLSDSMASFTIGGSAVVSRAYALPVGLTPVVVRVVAEDGTTEKSYVVIFSRARANTAPYFQSAPADMDSLIRAGSVYLDTMRARDDEADSLVYAFIDSVAGMTMDKGVLSWTPILTDTGLRTITAKVSDTSGLSDTLSWTIRVLRPLGVVADLDSIGLSLGALAPVFNRDSLLYTVTVGPENDSFTLTPFVSDSNASLTINSLAVSMLTVALVTGNTPIFVRVTAEDGIIEKAYTVNVFRTPSADARITGLVVTDGLLTPAFDTLVTRYADSLPNFIDSIALRVTAAHARATISVNDSMMGSGDQSPYFHLAAGDNRIIVKVTAENTFTSTACTVTVVRAKSGNASLSGLTVSAGTLSPAFDSSLNAFTDTLEWQDSAVYVTATAAHASASVTWCEGAMASGVPYGPVVLPVGSFSCLVELLAEDGVTSRSYSVEFVRKSALPVISGLRDTLLEAGQAFAPLSLDSFVDDPEDPDSSLVWSVNVIPGLGSIRPGLNPFLDVGSLLVFNLQDPQWYGVDTLVLTVTDPHGLSDTDTVVYSRAGWRGFMAGGTSEWFNGMDFPTYNQGWVVGAMGTITHTANHGQNWAMQNSHAFGTFRSVHFSDSLHGAAVGDAKLLRVTFDGGVTWDSVPDPFLEGYNLTSVQFADAANGWIVGRSGDAACVYRTADSGRTWVDADPGDKLSQSMYGVHAFSGAKAVATGEWGWIWMTDDGGATWDSVNTNASYTLMGITFTDNLNGWAVGGNSTIMHTDDGGATWNQQGNYDMMPLASVSFVNADTGWAIGSDQVYGTKLVRTVDGGAHWQALSSPIWGDANCIVGFDVLDAMFIRIDQVYRYGVQVKP